MRPFLIWRDEWKLGNDRLDRQHMEFAHKLNEIHRLLLIGDGEYPENLARLCGPLAGLAEMARRHFQDEEALMRSHRYPERQAHHREHAMLLAEMHECLREIEAGRRAFSLHTLTALKYWQIDHVMNSDRKLAAFLAQGADTRRPTGHTTTRRTA